MFPNINVGCLIRSSSKRERKGKGNVSKKKRRKKLCVFESPCALTQWIISSVTSSKDH